MDLPMACSDRRQAMVATKQQAAAALQKSKNSTVIVVSDRLRSTAAHNCLWCCTLVPFSIGWDGLVPDLLSLTHVERSRVRR
jgi:hypothetical protein